MISDQVIGNEMIGDDIIGGKLIFDEMNATK